MAAVGLAGAFKYGTKYLGYLVVVLAIGGAVAGVGSYLAAGAGVSLATLSVAALTEPRAAAGVGLVVLGALLTVAGLVGLGFKLLTDAAMVGVRRTDWLDEAVDGPATGGAETSASVADAGSPTDRPGGDADAAAGEGTDPSGGEPGDAAGPGDDATDPDTTGTPDESTGPDATGTSDDGAGSPTGESRPPADRPATADGAEASTDGSTPGEAGAATGSVDGDARPASAGTGPGDAAAGPTSERAEATGSAPIDGVEIRSSPDDGATDDGSRAGNGTGSEDASAPAEGSAASAVAAAIEEEARRRNDGGTAANGSGGVEETPVTDRETRVKPPEDSSPANGDPAGAIRGRESGTAVSTGADASGRQDDDRVVDEHDTTADEWTPPDPEEFERRTGGDAGAGGGNDSSGAGTGTGTGGSGAVDDGTGGSSTVGTSGEGADADADPDGGLLDGEEVTLADEGVSSFRPSADDDPLADSLTGDDR